MYHIGKQRTSEIPQYIHVPTAGRSTYWDGPRTSSPGQSLANIGLQCSRKHESAKSQTELYLVSVTTTTLLHRFDNGLGEVYMLIFRCSDVCLINCGLANKLIKSRENFSCN